MSKQRVSGKDLQKSVIGRAQQKGWVVAHFPSVETKQGWRTPLAGNAKGWPDLLLLRERLIAIEIKGDGDSLRPEQREWAERFHRAGVEHYVVTPKDWFGDTVEEILS